PLPAIDEQRLLDPVDAEGDRFTAERGRAGDAVGELAPRRLARETERERVLAGGGLQSAAADLELAAEGGVDARRQPDEGRRAQRRSQLPRQVSRCVVCLRAAESGELGDGEEGGEQERGGGREEDGQAPRAHGRAPGFRRAR